MVHRWDIFPYVPCTDSAPNERGRESGQELAPKYPAARPHFDLAAGHFRAEADALHACAELLFPGWKLPKEADAERNIRAATLLAQAQESYTRGIEEIDRALQIINKEERLC